MAGSEPKLTVAIPTFNGEAHLAETLGGILAQTEAAFDLLVVDDRSDDGTRDLVRALAGDRPRVEVNSERLGLAGNWNRCVALSRTPWVAIFHQDDLSHPYDLAARLSAIRNAADDVGLIAGLADVVDQKGRAVPPSIVDPGGIVTGSRLDSVVAYPAGAFFEHLSQRNILRCSAVTTSKRAHEAVGGFDPSYRYVVDWDFWLRVAARFGVVRDNAVRVSIRWHGASETHRFKGGLDDLEETERLLSKLPTPTDRATSRRLARAYLNRAHDALGAGQTDLARQALKRSIRLAPSIMATVLADPRLAVRMGTLALAPRLADRWRQSGPAD